MSTPSSPQRRVLFVDDDPQFLQTVTELMRSLSGGDWEIFTADGAGSAFALLQEHPMDLAVIDVQMSVVDGIQLLTLLNRGHPNVQKAVLTGHATDKYRTECLASGADLFLEKPTTPAGWGQIHAALTELLRFHTQQGFRGVLRQVGLGDVIQMECLARHSTVLEVSDAQVRGEVYLEQGQIVHARLGALQGEEAFNQLLGLMGGQFNLRPFAEPPARTLTGQWEFLLMEAARKRDEAEASQAPPAPAGGPLRMASLPAQARVETLLAMEEAAAQPATAVPAMDVSRPRITQVLMCSNQGEVLCEWGNCDRATWISFFEFLSQRSQRLSQGLPLGDFDRLEIVLNDSRMSVIIAMDRGVLVVAENAEAVRVSERTVPAPGMEHHTLVTWMRQLQPLTGETRRAMRFADYRFMSEPHSEDLTALAVEQAWRCLDDTFEVLAANRLHPESLIWQYQGATLQCARRRDGAVFGVLLTPGRDDARDAQVTALLAEFRQLAAG